MTDKNDETNTLQHYGVLGMKWGIRNSRRDGGPGTKYEKKLRSGQDQSSRAKSKRAQKKLDRKMAKNLKNLSDEELKAFKDRLELEKRVKDLTNQDLHSGKMYVANIIKNSAASIITNAAITAGRIALEKSYPDIFTSQKTSQSNQSKAAPPPTNNNPPKKKHKMGF